MVRDAHRVTLVEITSSWEHTVYVKWIEVDNANGDRIPYNRGEGWDLSPLGGRTTLGNWGPSNFPASIDFGAVKVAGRHGGTAVEADKGHAIYSDSFDRARTRAQEKRRPHCLPPNAESHDKSRGGRDEPAKQALDCAIKSRRFTTPEIKCCTSDSRENCLAFLLYKKSLAKILRALVCFNNWKYILREDILKHFTYVEEAQIIGNIEGIINNIFFNSLILRTISFFNITYYFE